MKGVHQCRSIFLREFFSYFNSPIAYIFIVVFVILSNGMFMANFFLIGNADMRAFFNLLPLILCIFIPAITMRLWAEEKRGNTFELLLTFPMKTYKLVFGKFLASFVFYILILASTLVIPIMLTIAGHPDMGPIIGGYLGAVFIGAFFLSIGIFISGLCKDQIVSFIVAMMVCFFFFLSGLDFMAVLIDGWLPGVGSFLKNNFGMTRHFASFEKGVIDNKDILYFFVMTAAFLTLNIFAIDDRMRPKAKFFFLGAVGVCLAMSMVFNALVVDIPLGRYDLTENKLYTITKATTKILKSLKSPVNVKLYISPGEKMPTAYKSLEQDIKDQLEELRILSGGKLIYKIMHMEAAQESLKEAKEESLEDKLQQKGIAPFQVQSIEEDEMAIKVIYSSIAIAYKEKPEAIISRILPQTMQSFEYDLISKIYRLTLDKRPVVALVAPYTEKRVDPKMMAFLRKMGGQVPQEYRDDKFKLLEAVLRYEDYDLRRINLSASELILKDVDTLIMVAAKDLNERQRYEINRFLNEGGNVVIAAQGYEYDYSQSRRGVSIVARENQHGFNELLTHYGVKISDDLLMDQSHEVLAISGGRSFGPFSASIPVKVPMQILVNQETMNQDVSITGRLSSFFYLWGSALELDAEAIKKSGLNQTVLFSSSKESWSVPYHSGPLTRKDITRIGNYDGNKPLGVLLEGQFPNSFKAQNTIPAWPKDDLPESVQSEGTKPVTDETPQLIPTFHARPGKLVVIGCSKMFEEGFVKQGGVLPLFVNAIDALTLGGDLIDIRGNTPINRKIATVKKGQKIWFRFMTVLLVPLCVVICGGARAILRRKEKDEYIKLVFNSMS